MKKAMMMTVGTGTGTSSAEQGLAHALADSIKQCNPELVVFVVTEKSKLATLPLVKQQIENISTEEILLNDFNDINEIYKQILSHLLELKNNKYHVTIDFTSGTKAMSAAAVLAGAKEFVHLNYITGKRGKHNVVINGKEQMFTFKPVESFLSFQEEILKQFFNNHHFDPGITLLSKMKQITIDEEIINKLNHYHQLFEGFSLWDKFNHEETWETLQTYDNEMLTDITEHKKFLSSLPKSQSKKNSSVFGWLIPDLLNNAHRRIEEGRFDDAVARLYRCVEMIAQFILQKEYNIKTDNVTYERLMQLNCENMNHYTQRFDNKNSIQLAMKQSYQLLNDLHNSIGKSIEKQPFPHLLQKRNYSILAHGITPVNEQDAKQLFNETKNIAEQTIPDLEKKMMQARFPAL